MDLATIAGLVVGLGCVLLGLVLEGAKLTSFFSLSSGLIVLGGSAGAVFIGSAMSDMKRIPQLFISIIKPHRIDWHQAVKDMSALAVSARRDGLLSLESAVTNQKDDFIRCGLRLIVDGADSEILTQVLETRLEATEEEHKRGEKMFEQFGGYLPTLGIVGTVTGLIHVLGNLSEPEKLGHSIAVAFIATLYGISFANVVFLPCASKLKINAEEESRYYRMITTGLLAVQAGENPLVTEEKMRSYITEAPPAAAGGGAKKRGSHGGESAAA